MSVWMLVSNQDFDLHSWHFNDNGSKHRIVNRLPAITLSTAYSKFFVSTDFSFSLAACKAASLQILAISAPGEIKSYM